MKKLSDLEKCEMAFRLIDHIRDCCHYHFFRRGNWPELKLDQKVLLTHSILKEEDDTIEAPGSKLFFTWKNHELKIEAEYKGIVNHSSDKTLTQKLATFFPYHP